MEFLTPELFNTLIIANIAVGVLLAAWRFYMDMTRKPTEEEQRIQEFDEYSRLLEEDTRPRRELFEE